MRKTTSFNKNKNDMRKFTTICCILSLFFTSTVLVTSCSSDGGTTEPEFSVVLSVDSETIINDGLDFASFKVEKKEGTNVTNVTANAVITNVTAGSALDGKTFFSTEKGTYTFKATYNGKESNTVTVNVKEDDGEEPGDDITYIIAIGVEKITINKGETYPLSVNVIPSDPSHTDYEVVWGSTSPSTASVDNDGVVTANLEGKTTISAKVKGTRAVATCEVTVIKEIVPPSHNVIYRLTLSDKGNGGYSTSAPNAYLSQRAIDRRTRQGISITDADFPISDTYLQAIKATGAEIVSRSKWLNTVCVYFHDVKTEILEELEALSFVTDTELVWREYIGGSASISSAKKFDYTASSATPVPFGIAAGKYGAAEQSIKMHNGDVLHTAGYEGNGMVIAVVDAGFDNLSVLNASGINVLGAKSFIHNNPNTTVNAADHGLHVLSCMAGNEPNKYVGTAPKASYWLLRTERLLTEYQVEEDYMVAAFEYADSVGADVVSTSLSYVTFYDYTPGSHEASDMDGNTALATRGAEAAFKTGMLMVNCAGNENRYVGAPADGAHVLTVGGVTPSYTMYSQCSKGYTADGRYKPDVLSLADPAPVITLDGSVIYITGTSFATPIISGLATCLWQAYPNLTNQQILDVIKDSCDKQGITTDSKGIPDMTVAMTKAALL